MNLMFWKKKTGFGEEAENSRENPAVNTKLRESLDFATTKQDIAERNPESPEQETPAKPGLAAQLKLRFTALTRYFKKTPVFRADEDHAQDALGGSEKPDDAATIEPDLEPPDMEAPTKPGLAVWVKLRLIALTRHFKKTSAPDAEPVRSKKRLVIGGAIGLLVLLLLGIGVTIWPVFPPPQEQRDTRHNVATIASRASQPGSAPEKSQTEIEVLKKENAELQARIEALKKELPQQQSYVPSARYAGGNVPSSSASGEMMIGNKDPKDTAMTLKEAIEAMNASSGDHAKKPAK
ncbi:MAG TPA: hypothetical protein VFQ97_00065 [Gallionella sp.]|nr:hypothetical protein [Gallionella sp.]